MVRTPGHKRGGYATIIATRPPGPLPVRIQSVHPPRHGIISFHRPHQRSFHAMEDRERARALELTLGQIEKQFGKGSILRLGSKEAIVPVAVISTGSIALDAALGIGGFPRGRICEIYGPESSGKTTIALQVVAQAQKAGGMAAFIDVEHALDPIYARKLGVDVDNLLVSQPDFGEQALDRKS